MPTRSGWFLEGGVLAGWGFTAYIYVLPALFMSRLFQLRFFLAFIIISAIGCGTNTPVSEKTINDTTAALSLLLNKEFLSKHMPGFGGLQRPSLFGDTILFRTDSIISGHVPESINGFHFKFLTDDQICQQAIEHYTNTTYFPNFLQLNRFQKQDSTYDIALQVTCVMPMYDKSGKKLFADDTSSYKCMFGMMCGGGIGVTVYEEGDTLKIRRESSWSD